MDNIDEYGPNDFSLAQKYTQSKQITPNIHPGSKLNPTSSSNVGANYFDSEYTNRIENRNELTPENRTDYVNQLYNKYELKDQVNNDYHPIDNGNSGQRHAVSGKENWTPNVRNLLNNLKSMKATDLMDLKTDDIYNKAEFERLIPNDDIIDLNKTTIKILKSQNDELKNQNQLMIEKFGKQKKDSFEKIEQERLKTEKKSVEVQGEKMQLIKEYEQKIHELLQENKRMQHEMQFSQLSVILEKKINKLNDEKQKMQIEVRGYMDQKTHLELALHNLKHEMALQDNVINSYREQFENLEIEFKTKLIETEQNNKRALNEEINCHSLIRQERDSLYDEVQVLKDTLNKCKNEGNHIETVAEDISTFQQLYENQRYANEEQQRMLLSKQRQLEMVDRNYQNHEAEKKALHFKIKHLENYDDKTITCDKNMEKCQISNFLLGLEQHRLNMIHNRLN